MATTTVTPVQNSTGSPTNVSNTPLTLSIPGKSPQGLIASNSAKESFFLLDLFQELKNVGTALGEFKCNHGKYVSVTGIKHLEVMVQSLELIYSAGTKQVGKISSVKCLLRAFKLKGNAIKNRNAKDPMHAVRGGLWTA